LIIRVRQLFSAYQSRRGRRQPLFRLLRSLSSLPRRLLLHESFLDFAFYLFEAFRSLSLQRRLAVCISFSPRASICERQLEMTRGAVRGERLIVLKGRNRFSKAFL